MQRREFLKSTAIGAMSPVVLGTTMLAADQSPAPRVKELRDRIRPITMEERLGRLEQARRLMAAEGIDLLVCEGGVTLNYFTGINWGRSERLFAMLLPGKGDPSYIVPKFEEGRAREQIQSGEVLTWEEDESPYRRMRDVVMRYGITGGTFGVEENVRFFVTDSIGREFPQARLVSGTPVTAGCRSVKSPHELELMQVANEITAEVYKASIPLLKEGMLERDFASILSRKFSEFGVGGGALVLFGEASAYPHGMIKEHALRENDVVLIDGGCGVEGYDSDVTRTTVFGTPTEKMKQVWSTVRDAQSAALKAARPGVAAETLDAAARDVITKAGYGPGFSFLTHRLGHGIGMDGHEWYYLVGGNKRPIVPGNVFTNEPGIYIRGEFGVRLEDEMVIAEDGAHLMLNQASSFTTLF